MAEKTELERFISSGEETEEQIFVPAAADEGTDKESESASEAPAPEETFAEKEEPTDEISKDTLQTRILTAEERSEDAEAPAAEEEHKIAPSDAGRNVKARSGAAAIRIGVANIVVAVLTLSAVAAVFFLFKNNFRIFQEETEVLRQKINSLEEEKKLLESDYIEAMNIIEEAEPSDHADTIGIEAESGKILIYDSSVGYAWIPVLSELPQHTYRKSGFSVDERGRMRYVENGEESSYFGIDVSSHQGDIDWQLVKEDGVEFAFLRVGYRGYGEEGRLCMDEKFIQNYEGAHDAGIDLGVYFFSQAVTAEEASEEAAFLLEVLDGRTLEYPVVYDWETVAADGDTEPRTENVMPQTLTLNAISFCEAVEDAGYHAMIYTNKKQAVMKYDLRQLRGYPVWLAYYDTNLNYCYDFDIWQYGTGSVDGIEGDVDLDIAMIK